MAIPPLNTSEFSRLDRAFADFLTQRSHLSLEQKPLFNTLVAHLSFEQSQGHTCLPLEPFQQALILASGLAQLVTDETPFDIPPQPLMVQSAYLYTHRYWFYEARLANQIKQRLQLTYTSDHLIAALDHYFPALENEIDWQKEAAKKALTQAFTIITGGPGTGKTTTVIKILALLQQLNAQQLTIALVAPTGKAAMRLQESIGFSKQGLACNDAIKQVIPEQVTTIHRLLGAKPSPSPYFKHHANNLLPYDVVVVDETSMVDVALMSKLVDALSAKTRLILLGDKDQLASVESGSVLADLTESLGDHSTKLLKSHRFGGEIKALSMAINQQQASSAWSLLQQGTDACLFKGDLICYVAERYKQYLTLIAQQADFRAIYSAFNDFQVLCSNRQKTNGVNDINYLVAKKLNLSGRWYQGRPIMVMENNPTTGLYNGDIGLCLNDDDNKLKVYFLMSDGEIKKVLPSRIPRCETVFAMTIHKSQGSEFKDVLVALPETLNPILTKELLYTAITRAKKTIQVLAKKSVFHATIAQKVTRYGGLKVRINASF
ncbi:MAG: exodeoxyribonuclease V subunit alpha [Methylococcales bacterium]|nr:exodeoxyribonuclease V subunit alpha [Methylococcales bacterium]